MIHASCYVDTYGETHVVARSLTYSGPEKPALLHVHGAEGGDGGAAQWMGLPSRWPWINPLIQDGHTLLSSDLGGTAWGNSDSVTQLDAAVISAQSLPGVKPGPVILLAQSMGALAALSWARTRQQQVSRIALVIPVLDLADVHGSIYRDSIDAAYGGYDNAIHGPEHSPIMFAHEVSEIPMQIWFGMSDTLCKPEAAVQFSSKINKCEARPIHGGHHESTLYAISPQEVVRFLA